MEEKVKRLAPSVATLRQLYMLSGNRCAFPGCTRAMINENGDFVGQVCHIEAANPGVERFNPQMTNDERRHISNLMLMCHEHHVVTDDVIAYPVEKLKKIKQDHEKKFQDIAGLMKAAIVDYGVTKSTKLAQNGRKLNRILSWNLNENDLSDTMKDINELSNVLSDVPLATRSLLGIMVMRSYKGQNTECAVPVDEVGSATNLRRFELASHIDSLERRKIVTSPEYNESRGCYECSLLGNANWNYWTEIRDFCKKAGVDISVICTDLDFSVFDE